MNKLTEWISVKDALPADGQEVLIYPEVDFCGDINCACFSGGAFAVEWEDSHQCGTSVVSPTHWMAYPQPPKGEV